MANDLYESVKAQNQQIELESAKQRDAYSTDKQRAMHMFNNIQGWNKLNFILWIFYYAIVASIVYLFVQNKIEMSGRSKFYIGTAFVLYPFLITTLELWTYNIYDYLKSLLLSLPYEKHSDKQPPLTILDAFPPSFYY